MGAKPVRVLVIGLDGATWALFEPWSAAGLMPNLRALMERGTRGVLRSTVPPLTPAAWSSAVTGKNPGKHGIYAFSRLPEGGYAAGPPVTSVAVRAPTLWQLASRAGCRVAVLNMPPSYPLRPVNGVAVACFMTPPGAPIVAPAAYEEVLGDYQVTAADPADLRPEARDFEARAAAFIRELRTVTEKRTAAALRLIEHEPWDLFGIVYYTPDRIQHRLWPSLVGDGQAPGSFPVLREAALDAFRTLDSCIGALASAAGRDAVVVCCSDHGFGPGPEHVLHLNHHLARAGFLHIRRAWALRRRLVRALPRRWRRGLYAADIVMLDLSRSAAWADSLDAHVAGVWVNLEGRFPQGTVPPAAYEGMRTRLVDSLRSLTVNGERACRRVARREELYTGSETVRAPDIVVELAAHLGVVYAAPWQDTKAGRLLSPWADARRIGTHQPEGVYLLAGGPARQLGAGPAFPIEAIAPTVLYLLGLPVPEDMDGPVMTAAIEPCHLDRHPVVHGPPAPDGDGTPPPGTASEADRARIEERLRALGYLG